MRDFGLKRREPGNLSPEKLLDILRGIYPEEVEQELLNQINEHIDQEEEDGK